MDYRAKNSDSWPFLVIIKRFCWVLPGSFRLDRMSARRVRTTLFRFRIVRFFVVALNNPKAYRQRMLLMIRRLLLLWLLLLWLLLLWLFLLRLLLVVASLMVVVATVIISTVGRSSGGRRRRRMLLLVDDAGAGVAVVPGRGHRDIRPLRGVVPVYGSPSHGRAGQPAEDDGRPDGRGGGPRTVRRLGHRGRRTTVDIDRAGILLPVVLLVVAVLPVPVRVRMTHSESGKVN